MEENYSENVEEKEEESSSSEEEPEQGKEEETSSSEEEQEMDEESYLKEVQQFLDKGKTQDYAEIAAFNALLPVS